MEDNYQISKSKSMIVQSHSHNLENEIAGKRSNYQHALERTGRMVICHSAMKRKNKRMKAVSLDVQKRSNEELEVLSST